MPKAAPASLKRLIPAWVSGSRTNIPTAEEIGKAVRRLRVTEPLCRLEAIKGNDGFSVSLSFNPVEYRSSPTDFIELALRSAHLGFCPKDPSKWSWSGSLKAFVHGNASQLTVKDTTQKTVTRSGGTASRTELEAGGEVNVPLLGGVKTGAKRALETNRGKTQSRSRSVDTTRSVTQRWAEIHRRGDDFELRLGSPGGEDLVRLNPDLDRIGVLAADEPSAVQPDDVKVTMRLQMQGELHHSLRVRDAGGHWARLVETRNKTIVSEILFAKFLKPAHAPQVLWPKRAR